MSCRSTCWHTVAALLAAFLMSLYSAPCVALPPVGEIVHIVQARAFSAVPEKYLQAAGKDPALKDADSLNSFLHAFDEYAAYISARDVREMKEMQSFYKFGVNMEITRNMAGDIICIPRRGGAADKSGIVYGDAIIGVDDYVAEGAALEDVALLVRGNKNSSVKLAVRRPSSCDKRLIFVVPRQQDKTQLVQAEAGGAGEDRIRIYGFSPLVVKNLRKALAAVQKKGSRSLIVDLRGNTGGDMESAIQCTGLFLPKGAILASIKTRNGSKTYRNPSKGMASDTPRNITILQDGLTASSAELFIAALSKARRAATKGTTSAGKARVQEVFKLANGDMLKLSVEELQVPGTNSTWQGKGLQPDRVVLKNSPEYFVSRKNR